MNQLSVEELKSLRSSGEPHFLLDVREQDEWAAHHIPGAHLIPLADLMVRLDEVPLNQRVIVHCKAGMRSARACGMLLDKGYADVWNVEGGMDAWLEMEHAA